MLKRIQFRGGTAAQNDEYTGEAGEITVDSSQNRLRVHDGSTKGGTPLAREDELPTRAGQMTFDVYYTKTSLTKLSQLVSASGDYWRKIELRKLSQLNNDVGYVSGHCSYCQYCSHCTHCS